MLNTVASEDNWLTIFYKLRAAADDSHTEMTTGACDGFLNCDTLTIIRSQLFPVTVKYRQRAFYLARTRMQDAFLLESRGCHINVLVSSKSIRVLVQLSGEDPSQGDGGVKINSDHEESGEWLWIFERKKSCGCRVTWYSVYQFSCMHNLLKAPTGYDNPWWDNCHRGRRGLHGKKGRYFINAGPAGGHSKIVQ